MRIDRYAAAGEAAGPRIRTVNDKIEPLFKSTASSWGSLPGRRLMLRQSSIQTLIVLIEEKLRSLAVIDREDKREKRLLESCHVELGRMLLTGVAATTAPSATGR
jgi:hypothetical protein